MPAVLLAGVDLGFAPAANHCKARNCRLTLFLLASRLAAGFKKHAAYLVLLA
jgi:hypothetical protein